MVDSARTMTSEPHAYVHSEDDLKKLSELVRATVSNFPRFPDFVARLAEQHIELQCNLTQKGRVSSLNYVFDSKQVSASNLADDFTWTGLQRKLGLEYIKNRDFQLLSSLAMPVEEQNFSADDDSALLSRLEKVEDLGKQILEKISTRFESAVSGEKQKSLDRGELLRIDEAVKKLEEIALNLNKSASYNDVSEHNAPLYQAPQQESQKSLQRVEAESTKTRQESFWMAVTAAMIAGLVSALITGLWLSQKNQESLEAHQQALIEHMDKAAEEDPLRAYFKKIMEKLP